MKQHVWLPALLALFLALTGCGQSGASSGAVSSQGGAPAGGGAASAQPAQSGASSGAASSQSAAPEAPEAPRFRLVSAADWYGNLEGEAQTTVFYSYDGAGRLVREETEGGGLEESVREYRYDDAGNLTEKLWREKDYLISSETNTYDAEGRLVRCETTWDGSPGQTSVYTYDDAGRKTACDTEDYQIGNPGYDVSHTDYTYDDAGRLVREDTVTQWMVDEQAALDVGGTPAELEPQKSWVVYSYDAQTKLLVQTERSDKSKTVFVYDAAGVLLREISGQSYSGSLSVVTYVYDAFGNCIEKQEGEHIDQISARTRYTYEELPEKEPLSKEDR